MNCRPGSGDLDAAVGDMAQRIRAALELPARAGVAPGAEGLRARLDEPLPEVGAPIEGILPELEERVAGTLAGTTGARYFGYVTGGVIPASVIVQAWATAVDQNPGLWALSPGGSEIDDLVLRWLAQLLGVPHPSGIITSGATMANIVGLAVARHWAGRRRGVDVAAEGVAALPKVAVYGNDELHLSDVKALRLLGFGERHLRRIPIDGTFRMRTELLRKAIELDRDAGLDPAIAIAQAGSVGIGTSDPLNEIADICEEYGLWLHVDAAWGAFLRVSQRHRGLVRGLERADSISVDGHKWLNLPHGIGFALLRDARVHREALAGSAAYLTRTAGAGEDSHERGIEASRPWRGAATWAALKELGRSGVEQLVERCCELAADLARRADLSDRLELVAPVPTIVVNLRYRPAGWPDGDALDDLNRRILDIVTAEGDVLVTGARFPSGFCQRATIASWRTERDDVLAVAEAIESVGDRLARDVA